MPGDRSRWVLLLAAGLGLAGCATPFGPDNTEQALLRRIASAVPDEVEAIGTDESLLQTTQPPGEVEAALSQRRSELEEIGPRVPFPMGELDLGADLTGGEQKEVTLSLQSAIVSAVGNNLSIQVARLRPAISEADVVAAEAVFDAVFVGSADLAKIDEPIPAAAVGMTLVGVPFSASERYRFETGVRKLFRSGGTVTLSSDLTRFRNRAPGLTILPDPAYTSAIRVGLEQPLLRGFGRSVNTTFIRLARNFERRSIQELRSELLDLLIATERAYWDLVFTWQDLAIQEWLLAVGIEVRDIMDRRRDFDIRLAQYADAVARVEQRKGNVIRARRAIRAASDQLKVLINDPRLTVGSEAILVPVDQMVEKPISYNLRETILTTVANRPEIKQAILLIDDSAIRETLADNQRLPLLNFSAQLSYFGLDDAGDRAYDELFEADFIDYVLGLRFEWPLGNRAAESGFRRARLERSTAVFGYQQAVQNVVVDTKAALRDCITDYELIQASRSFRIAQAENLRALLVEEEMLAGLTPEFLNLKFQTQETLATAQQQETQSLVSYNKSVAGLHRAMGVSLSMNQIELEVDAEPGLSATEDALPRRRD